jgi:hypothetical protein
VPWDDLLSAGADSPAALAPQTRLAYTALAGVLVTGLAREETREQTRVQTREQTREQTRGEPGIPQTRVRERSPGEHAD